MKIKSESEKQLEEMFEKLAVKIHAKMGQIIEEEVAKRLKEEKEKNK